MRFKIFALISTVLLSSCSAKYTHEIYKATDNEPQANVKFIALDKYVNNDAVLVSILERKSCSTLPNYIEVARLESKFLADDLMSLSNKLPTNKVLPLYVENYSDSSFVVTKCSDLKGFQFENDKYYSLEVKNWSSAEKISGKFGCEFAVFETNAEGKHIRELAQKNVELPNCD